MRSSGLRSLLGVSRRLQPSSSPYRPSQASLRQTPGETFPARHGCLLPGQQEATALTPFAAQGLSPLPTREGPTSQLTAPLSWAQPGAEAETEGGHRGTGRGAEGDAERDSLRVLALPIPAAGASVLPGGDEGLPDSTTSSCWQFPERYPPAALRALLLAWHSAFCLPSPSLETCLCSPIPAFPCNALLCFAVPCWALPGDSRTERPAQMGPRALKPVPCHCSVPVSKDS